MVVFFAQANSKKDEKFIMQISVYKLLKISAPQNGLTGQICSGMGANSDCDQGQDAKVLTTDYYVNLPVTNCFIMALITIKTQVKIIQCMCMFVLASQHLTRPFLFLWHVFYPYLIFRYRYGWKNMTRSY